MKKDQIKQKVMVVAAIFLATMSVSNNVFIYMEVTFRIAISTPGIMASQLFLFLLHLEN